MKTVLEVITATTDYFRKHGVESPRLNAEHLLAQAMGLKRLDLYMAFDRPLDEALLAPLREKVKLRGAGHPLQHLMGSWEFCGREFLCDPRALIPRPETEQLVEMLVKLGKSNPPAHIADVGTGGGVIAISLALEFPAARIEATDLSSGALALARENAARLCPDHGPSFLEGDLLAPIEPGLDWVVANLPYVTTAEMAALSREVGHDPALALDGGTDGLGQIRRLIPAALEKLLPGGLLALEAGCAHADGLRSLLETAGFTRIEVLPDHAGLNRFALAYHG